MDQSLVGYGPWGHEVGHDWATNTFTYVFGSFWSLFMFIAVAVLAAWYLHLFP